MRLVRLASAIASLLMVAFIASAQTAPATASAEGKMITVGQGSWTAFRLVGYNPYGDKKSFYSRNASKTKLLTVHARGSDERKGAEEITALIRFDLAKLPKDAKIKQARLVFPLLANYTPSKEDQNTLVVYQILAPWNDKVDWKTRDGNTAWDKEGAHGEKDKKKVAELVLPAHNYDSKTAFETSLDITELVKSWGADPSANNGLKLELLGGYANFATDAFRLEVVVE